MLGAIKNVDTVRSGDADGHGMVVGLTTQEGVRVHAVAVPQDRPSSTGPTWAYLFDHQGMNLIDPGAMGSYYALVDGLKVVGYRPDDIDRVFISHGHSDHDGGAGRLINESGAELWAHEAYGHLLKHDPWEVQRSSGTSVQRYMHQVFEAYVIKEDLKPSETGGRWRAQHDEYMTMRRDLEVTRSVHDGEQVGEMTMYHMPGHTPDSICVSLDGLLFTGDHVLPEITPHPTMKASLPGSNGCQGDRSYGLETYLRSLGRVVDIATDSLMMPAHRLFNRNRFYLQTSDRAQEIIDHHLFRLRVIMRKIGEGRVSLEEVTRGIFSKRALLGRNFYSALSEVVAHIEMLQDTEDIEWSDDGSMRAKSGRNYWRLVTGLTRVRST